jgi:hypothetical protein
LCACQALRQTPTLRATTPLHLVPKLNFGGPGFGGGGSAGWLEGNRTISTPRSWAAGLGSLPLVPERATGLGVDADTSSASRHTMTVTVTTTGGFPFPAGSSSSSSSRDAEARRRGEAENSFDVFSTSPAAAQQWEVLLKSFLQQAAGVLQECDDHIQKSRIDLMMRLQGRGGRRGSNSSHNNDDE